jgi:hypothetical protein
LEDVVETELNHLKELINLYQVCWKVWPEFAIIGRDKRQIGYEVELAGTPEPGVTHLEAGSEPCQRVFKALRQIAEYVIPSEEHPLIYEIGPFDQSIHYWRLHLNRPDVLLSVKILASDGYEHTMDDCEDRCLKEMEERLQDLGVARLQWTERHTESTGRPAA